MNSLNVTPVAAQLPLSKIRTGDNPRRYFDQAKHVELVDSLRLRGMLQPVLVRPAPDDMYVIVAGGRRYRAALEAFGPEGEVPVLIRELSDQEALEAAIDENDVREDASETEQADAAVRVLAACQDDRAEAARRLGWSPTKLDRRLALANLSTAVKTALDERRIKVGHAELLAVVPPDKQDTALQGILTAGLDVARTRAALMRMTHDLGTASFDKAECIACPFNSALQRALFDTCIEDGHCTNPGCFALKVEAAEAARLAAAGTLTTQTAETTTEAAETTSDSGAASAGPPPGGDAGSTAERSTPDSAPGSSPDQGRAPAAQLKPAAPPVQQQPAPGKPKPTTESIAAKARETREDEWRGAVARAVSSDDGRAINVILLAVNSGTLSQIADVPPFAVLTDQPDYASKIAAIRALSDDQAHDALRAIASAYVLDVREFSHVADLARAYGVDLRGSWIVDGDFLDRFGKDELRFIAMECGLVAHVGEKIFANLLKGKPHELIAGMLHATGFEWAGRLPSAMTLDGEYGPPPAADQSAAAQPDSAEPIATDDAPSVED